MRQLERVGTGLTEETPFRDQCLPSSTPSICLGRLLALSSHLEASLLDFSLGYWLLLTLPVTIV